MAIDPKGADLKRFIAEDGGGRVVMLNLLRFADTAALQEAVLQATIPWRNP